MFGWCPCIDCIHPEITYTDPKKPLRLKQKATLSKANEEPVAKKVDDHFLFDITTEELEKFMEEECLRTLLRVMNGWSASLKLGLMQKIPEDLCPLDNLFDGKMVKVLVIKMLTVIMLMTCLHWTVTQGLTLVHS